ncbi:hypothetical protein KUV64_27335, partial [Mameliella alba]
LSGAVLTWLAGETGRAVIAGAAGGLYRWLMQERRRLRDGIVAVAAGALAAQFLGPVVLAGLRLVGLKLQGTEAELAPTAGFLAGLAGMSIAKMLVALMETQAARLGKSK